jgi:hypothetical protein
MAAFASSVFGTINTAMTTSIDFRQISMSNAAKHGFTVQVFAQLVEFLETGRKENLSKFSNSEALRLFDREFDLELRREFLATRSESIRPIAEIALKRKKKGSRKALLELFKAGTDENKSWNEKTSGRG